MVSSMFGTNGNHSVNDTRICVIYLSVKMSLNQSSYLCKKSNVDAIIGGVFNYNYVRLCCVDPRVNEVMQSLESEI